MMHVMVVQSLRAAGIHSLSLCVCLFPPHTHTHPNLIIAFSNLFLNLFCFISLSQFILVVSASLGAIRLLRKVVRSIHFIQPHLYE